MPTPAKGVLSARLLGQVEAVDAAAREASGGHPVAPVGGTPAGSRRGGGGAHGPSQKVCKEAQLFAKSKSHTKNVANVVKNQKMHKRMC